MPNSKGIDRKCEDFRRILQLDKDRIKEIFDRWPQLTSDVYCISLDSHTGGFTDSYVGK